MKQIIDLENWPRREYFEHYSAMDNPYFSVTAEVDVTSAYRRTKAGGGWFYMRYLHAILKAVNAQEEFRYRIDNGTIVLFDRIHVSPTIGRKDGSFGFGMFQYDPDYRIFEAGARAETDRVQSGTGLMKKPENGLRIDTTYPTALPWLRFTEVEHPHNFGNGAGIMNMAMGKVTPCGDRLLMPLQVRMHHGFVDGRHAGRFYELVQQYLDEAW